MYSTHSVAMIRTFTAGGVVVRVGVEIAAMSLNVSDIHFGPICNVDGRVHHGMAAQGLLELWAHEPIALACIGKGDEMDLEHNHVHEDRQDDQTSGTSSEMTAKLMHRNAHIGPDFQKPFDCAAP